MQNSKEITGNKNGKPTTFDIAEKLGVSIATVNRALHDKPRVSRETRDKVLKTAEEIGFKTNRVAKSLSRKMIKIGMLLEDSGHDYTRQLIKGAESALSELEDYKVSGDIFATGSQPSSKRKAEMVRRINKYIHDGYNGIIINAQSTIFTEKDGELLGKCPVLVTVSTDISPGIRAFSVRPDGRTAGRMAGQMLEWLAGGGPVAVFTGNKDVQIHKEYVDGFLEYDRQSPLNLTGIYENQDDPEIAYHATVKLLKEYPEIGGIYINSSNSLSVCKKLKAAGLSGRVKLITTDIYPELMEYIEDGTVQASIFQDPYNQGRIVVNCLYKHITGERNYEKDILVRPQIILRSNLSKFTDNGDGVWQ